MKPTGVVSGGNSLIVSFYIVLKCYLILIGTTHHNIILLNYVLIWYLAISLLQVMRSVLVCPGVVSKSLVVVYVTIFF